MTDYGTWRPTNFRYLTAAMLDSGVGPAILGGITLRMKAAASLKFGELVQVTASAGYVATATTALNLTLGIVVGGTNTVDEVLTDSSLVDSTICADAEETVLVQRAGVCYGILDTDDVTIGNPIKPSAITAGRVGLGVAAYTVPAGVSTVFSSGSSGAIISGNGPATPIIGFTQTTSTVAGSAVLLILKGLI